MEENENKLHFNCTDFNSSTRVSVYAERIYVLTEYLQHLCVRTIVIFFDKMWLALRRAGRCVVACGSSELFNSLLTPHSV